MNTAYANIGEGLQTAGDLLRQERPCEAEALYRALLDTEPPLTARERALVLDGRGRAQHALDMPTDAVKAFQESLALLRESVGPHPVTAGVLQHLSRALIAVGDIEASLVHGREAVDMLKAVYGEDHPQVAAAQFGLSYTLYTVRRYDEAETLVRQAMAAWERHLGPHCVEMATCLNNLGRIHEERGELDLGIACHRRSVAIRQDLLGDHPETGFGLGNLGTALASAGLWAEAVTTLAAAVACYERIGRGSGYEVDGYRRNLQLCREALAAETASSASH